MKSFLKRVLKDNAQFIDCCIKDNSKGYYKVYAHNERLVIEADCKIHIAAGLYRYLKDVLNINYSWCGNTEISVDKLNFNFKPIYAEIVQKYISMFNYCTYGYSMAYWNWERWEKELDFMAMNGVNLPLFVVGIEAVWYKTLLLNGCTKEEALSFISSPSHFPWQLMTNIEGVMPVMSEKLIEKRLVLGQKIMKRMLELGMQPIQMGFSGFVPSVFKKKYYKSSDIRQKNNWCAIDGTWEVNPKDPLFKKIGTQFLNIQKELFGAYHFYACDPFHESEPPVDGKDYLVDVSKSIQDMYLSFDKDYKWVMQSWSLREDIVKAVPKDRILILDLAGVKHESTDYFWGYDYLSGNLHNFGGRINLHGDIRMLCDNKYLALKEKSNIVGTGLFMEGINQNPLYYDLALTMLTKNEKMKLDEFLDNYTLRRYGSKNENLREGLTLLSNSVYREGTNAVESSSMICARPAINVKKSGPNKGFTELYDKLELLKALKIYLECFDEKLKDGYFFDLYDIARQASSNALQFLSKKIKAAYENKDSEGFNSYTESFLKILNLVDSLLLTRKELNLYNNLNEAKTYTYDEEINDKLVKAYKALFTIWADIEEPQIFDYAWREWGGFIGEFYFVRWKMFFDYLKSEILKEDGYSSEKESELPQIHGREAFFANEIYRNIAEFENAWVREKYEVKEVKQNNLKTYEYAKELYNLIVKINK